MTIKSLREQYSALAQAAADDDEQMTYRRVVWCLERHSPDTKLQRKIRLVSAIINERLYGGDELPMYQARLQVYKQALSEIQAVLSEQATAQQQEA